MISSSLSIALGIAFVAIGALNVWLILQSSIRVKQTGGGARLIAAHRIGGYIFIALFCALGYFMVARLGDVASGAPPSTMIHLTLAMVLSPLLFVKVLIARYYKSHYSLLMPIGLLIFVLSFVLIGITVGPSLAHHATMQTVSLDAIDMPLAAIDLNLAAGLMEKRCSKCHNLDRIAGARKDARGWLETVTRMRKLPDSGISEEDSRTIVSWLASQMAPKDSTGTAHLQVARALVDQRCGRCHSLDRVYKTTELPAEWKDTVARMVGYGEGSANALHPGEAEQIVAYLSATQTPDAVGQKKAHSEGSGLAESGTAGNPPAPGSRHDSKAIIFISCVCLGVLALIIRRPARTPFGGVKPDSPIRPPVSGGPVVLRLARITRQTNDARTLRFVLPDGVRLNARPGQFLTFSFLFDGKKIARSYSICSSPARSGYVEITPKRVQNGSASVFLNDRADVGMTVEATGAFGQFCFDERKHGKAVLIAAGSGITPMMAMLRYIDDLCLDTAVTLLYCVRTSEDVIFHGELEGLRKRLKNFDYHVLFSQPAPECSGPRGRISREFIAEHVTDLGSPSFFLCGPEAFMETGREILTNLGVPAERIHQESFGSSAIGSGSTGSPTALGGTVEFARSGKTCTVRSDQSLLDAAEEHGVPIAFGCRQGQCGTCKTRLLAGAVDMRAEAGLDPESRAQGFVLTCVGHPNGDVKLDA